MYWALYAIASVGIYILDTANSKCLSSPLWSATRAFGAFSSVTVLYLVLAVLAVVMFRVERRRGKTLAEISSDAV